MSDYKNNGNGQKKEASKMDGLARWGSANNTTQAVQLQEVAPALVAPIDPEEVRKALLVLDRLKEENPELYGKPVAELSDRELYLERMRLKYLPDGKSYLKGIKVWTDEEIMSAKIEGPEWVVEGLVPVGLTVVAGSFKVGKSFLGLQLCHAVQGGTEFLRHKTQKGNVVYLALEDSVVRTRARKEKMGLTGEAGIKYIYNVPLLKAVNDVIGFVLDIILTYKAKMIVIDTLGSLMNMVDLNDYTMVYNALGDLREIAQRSRVAIVLVHHTRKSSVYRSSGTVDPFDRILGSVGISGVADALVMLERERRHNSGRLQFTSRDAPEQELIVNFNENGVWTLVGDAREIRMTEDRRKILELLQEADGRPLSTGQIARELDKKESAVSRLLRRMRDEGMVRRAAKWGTWCLMPDYEGAVIPRFGIDLEEE
jgi:DNA-binding transcriptional ArsR family regulator/archaellum biogenesis ATPase FlaH